MNILKFLTDGVLLWIFVSITVYGTMFFDILNDQLTLKKILEVVIVTLLAFIFAKIYFKSEPGGLGRGLMIGFLWALLIIFLDILIIIPTLLNPVGLSYADHFMQLNIWYFYGLIILLTGLVGAVKKE